MSKIKLKKYYLFTRIFKGYLYFFEPDTKLQQKNTIIINTRIQDPDI